MLKSLVKIASTRKRLLPKDIRQSFYQEIFNSSFLIMQIFTKNLASIDGELINELNEYLLRISSNYGLHKIRNHVMLSQDWVNELINYSMTLLNIKGLKLSDNYFKNLIEIHKKLIKQI